MKALHRLLLKVVASFSKVAGKIHAPFTHKRMTSEDYRSMKALMKPGDILITSTRGELTTILIPGFWSHNAIVVDENSCVEAIGLGVVKTDLIDFILTRDYAVLMRPKNMSDEQLQKVADFTISKIGAMYDYEFESDNEQFYCSELAYRGLKEVDPKFPFELRERMGQMTVVPEDFWRAADKFDLIWSSKSFRNV